MNYDWISYLANIAVTLLVASGVGYFVIKTMFKGWVDKRIEIELAKVKGEIQGELDYKATKHKFVYERKIAVLCDVLQKLWMLEQSVMVYVSLWGKTDRESRKGSAEGCLRCWQDLDDCFEPNRMFFTEELAKAIEHFKGRHIEAIRTFALFVQQEEDEPKITDTDKWLKVNDFVKTESPELRRAIEQELRQEFQK